MKRVYLLFVLFFFCFYLNAQTVITMEKEGGIFKISCKVNGAPMKMYFDTGATSVSISKSTAIYLFENDLLKKEDIKGKANTITAEGAISENMVVNIRDIEISGLHLKNVEAVISSSLNAPLLLGQSAIQKLGKISLNGSILTIHNSNKQDFNKGERTVLNLKLKKIYDERNVWAKKSGTIPEEIHEILDIVERIERIDELNDFEFFCKIWAKYGSEADNEDELKILTKEWIDKFAIYTDCIECKMRIYLISACCNFFSDNPNAETGFNHLLRCQTYWEKQPSADMYWNKMPIMYAMYYGFYKKQGFKEVINAYQKTIRYCLRRSGITINNINANLYPQWYYSDMLGGFAQAYKSQLGYLMGKGINNKYDNDLVRISTILAAKAGDEESIDFCRRNNINYKAKLSKEELEYVRISE